MHIVISFLLVLVFTISMSITTATNAEDLQGCTSDLLKLTLDTSTENNFYFSNTDQVVLLEGTCSQLKSGACGTGTCEKGWHCMDTGVQCLCSPPQ